MKNSHRLTLVTALTAVLALPCGGGQTRAEDNTAQPASPGPGFVPDPGIAPASRQGNAANIPTAEEARAALMTPVSKQPSTGDTNAATTGAGTQGMPGTHAAGASNEPPPSGPIGSFGQTIPAKFSKRNDTLDRVPIMATPLPLSDEQRKKIYDAVMADNSQLIAGADALEPASELSPSQALKGMHPLPESVRGIDGVARLNYVKAKSKILLVEPATRTVVGEITSS